MKYLAFTALCVLCTSGHAHSDADEEACKRASLMYAYYADTSQPLKMPSLFTEDGVWVTSGGRLEGRAVIEKQMAAASSGEVVMRHVITNHLIFEDGAGNLSGRAYFTLYRSVPGDTDITHQPVMMGTYEDTYEMQGGACLFSSRMSSATFKRVAE
jgi:hypothetical protein